MSIAPGSLWPPLGAGPATKGAIKCKQNANMKTKSNFMRILKRPFYSVKYSAKVMEVLLWLSGTVIDLPLEHLQ